MNRSTKESTDKLAMGRDYTMIVVLQWSDGTQLFSQNMPYHFPFNHS